MEHGIRINLQQWIENEHTIPYIARNGKLWYIMDGDDTFSVFNTDGDLQFGYPTLSICQEAIETDSIYWKGEGWYRPVAFNWESERIWCNTPEEVKQLEDDTAARFTDRPSGVEFCGSEDKPDNPYESIRDLLD